MSNGFGYLFSDGNVGTMPHSMPGTRWVPSDEVFGLGQFASTLLLGQDAPAAAPAPATAPAPVKNMRPSGGVRLYGEMAFYAIAATGGVLGFMNSNKTWHKVIFGLTVLGAASRVVGGLMRSDAPKA